MLKTLLAAILSLLAAAAFAAVDANKATQAELESIKGIGPAIAAKILDERKKGSFKDWNDMVVRVKGVGETNAAKFSTDGLTVNGAAFSGAPAPMAKQEGKTTMKAAKTTPAATPPAPAADAGTKTAAATDATRAKEAEKRAARDAALAEKKAARKAAAAASAPASAAAKKK